MNQNSYQSYGGAVSYPTVSPSPPPAYPQITPPTNEMTHYNLQNSNPTIPPNFNDSYGYQDPYTLQHSTPNYNPPRGSNYPEVQPSLAMNVSSSLGHENVENTNFNGLTPSVYGAGADSIGNTYGRVLAYEGGPEPYGARGTGSGSYWESEPKFETKSNTYSIKSSSFNNFNTSSESDGGIQRFRVRLLPESQYSGSPQNVLCQVGLDGVKLIDPDTSRTLRIYPLDTITSWAVKDSNVFTFWAKTSVDLDQRAVIFQSDEYTTTAILDSITAACVQLFEMVGKDMPKNVSEKNENENLRKEDQSQSQTKSNPFPIFGWIPNRSKDSQAIEKDHWVPDEMAKKCSGCDSDFNAFNRKHHCRNCGNVFCDKCTRGRTPLTNEENTPVVRVCDHCLAEITQHLTNLTENDYSTNKENNNVVSNPLPKSHHDLAKKLQEEMERSYSNRSTQNVNRNLSTRNSFDERTIQTPTHSWSNNSFSANDNYASGAVGNYGNNSLANGNYGNNDYGNYAGSMGGPRMREVACPTCTVHLQVQVPDSGTETVECGYQWFSCEKDHFVPINALRERLNGWSEKKVKHG